MHVDVRGAGADLAGDHRLAVHGAFEQRDAERFRTQVRRKRDGVAEPEQRRLVEVVHGADEMHVCQAQAPCTRLQLRLDRSRADDHDGITGAGHGVEQDVQALVITQHADEQEEFVAHARAPAREARSVRFRIAGLVEPERDHARLVAVAAQHGRRGQVVRRRGDDRIDAVQEPVHQRPVQLQQHFLAHDVGVVGDDGRLVDTGQEMRQVHEGPRKMVMHDVRRARHARQPADRAQRHGVRRHLDIQRHAVDRIAFVFERREVAPARQRQHLVRDAQAPGAGADLADDLLDAADGIGKMGLVKMQDTHGLGHGRLVPCSRAR